MTDDSDQPAGSPQLAGLLRRLRERALLTQEELAERTGLSIRTIRGLESNRLNRPRSGSLRVLADALGLSDRERALLLEVALGEPPLLTGSGTAGRAGATPASSPVLPAQLPADAAEFTGRSDCLKWLGALLPGDQADGPTAVVITAIAGTAGVGKTALAVHWAHRVTARFPDGQLSTCMGTRPAHP